MLIIDDLILLPAQILWKMFDGVKGNVDEELYPDEEQCKEKLLALQMALETDQITEDDYEPEEEKIMKRLRFLREYRKKEAGE